MRKGPKHGPGKCYECGEIIHPWQDGWNGKEGTNHYPEYAMGGGNVERFKCGPIFREDE
jgi:hypothetical protein